jgi:iron-sulfur cluster assembly protein
MYVHLTDRAIEAFRNKLEKRGTPNAHIRLGIQGSGGCSGLRYYIGFEDDVPRKHDLHFFYYGIRVLTDVKSAAILDECSLDYKSSLKESGFVFSNPREKSRCGCGESFNV